LFDYKAARLTLIRLDAHGNPMEALPTWEYEPKGSFPVMTTRHIVSVQLKFGSKRLWFGLDSGAEQNLLNVNINKKFLAAHFDVRKRVKLSGVGRESIEVLSGMLQHAELDTFQFMPMATLITQMSDINAAYETNLHGILGYEFLSQLPMSVNPRKRRLTFYKAVSP
jgi:Aspartyl protease